MPCRRTPIHSTILDSSELTPEAGPPILVFRVGDALYGCEVEDAQEIIPMRSMTRLPGAPPFVRGLINVRGIIVTVIDLGARLAPGVTRRAAAAELEAVL